MDLHSYVSLRNFQSITRAQYKTHKQDVLPGQEVITDSDEMMSCSNGGEVMTDSEETQDMMSCTMADEVALKKRPTGSGLPALPIFVQHGDKRYPVDVSLDASVSELEAVVRVITKVACFSLVHAKKDLEHDKSLADNEISAGTVVWIKKALPINMNECPLC